MEHKSENPIAPFDMQIEQDGKRTVITIQQVKDVFEIIQHGRVIGVLKPPGEDWQLLPLEQIADQIPLFEIDLEKSSADMMTLHAPLVNQIAGEIENHLKHL